MSDSVSVRVQLSQSSYNEYEKQAAEFGVSVEEVMGERLNAAAKFIATKPIYIDDEYRHKLDACFEVNLQNQADLMREVEKLVRLQLGTIAKVNLPTRLLERLKSRCLGKQEFNKWLPKVTIEELERYVGLR